MSDSTLATTASTQANAPAPGVAAIATGSRLAGVDGLRAFAALWVVMFHITAFSQASFPHPNVVMLLLRSGSTGVSLFLVLSGFCLYVPFAGGNESRFTSRDFFLRRCRRLLPAYYTSLVCVLVLYVGVGAWLGFQRFNPNQLAWQLLAHVTLTHSLFPDTFYALDGAYWSLALEWQLYLALPLLIWGIRRYGMLRTAACAVLCNIVYRLVLALVISRGLIAPGSALAIAVLPNILPGRWAEFVIGMIAAELYATGRVASVAKFAWLGFLLGVPASLTFNKLPLGHLLFGITYASLLCLVLSSTSLVNRVFSWRPLVALGIMSYSIYLVHQPLVQGLAYLLQGDAGLSHNTTFFALMLLMPVILAVAWLLFITVERRSIKIPLAEKSRFPFAIKLARRDTGQGSTSEIAALPALPQRTE
jgi:peptidoglycan/LPS O-acetylase OafA/YrhL